MLNVVLECGMWEGCDVCSSMHFANLAWPRRALSWCRRTSVRPPDDIEKSVAHRLHCAMPLSGNFAIQAPPILVKLAFTLRCHFFNGGSAISYPENMENSARKLSEERDYPMGIHHPRHVTVAVFRCRRRKKETTVTGDCYHA